MQTLAMIVINKFDRKQRIDRRQMFMDIQKATRQS